MMVLVYSAGVLLDSNWIHTPIDRLYLAFAWTLPLNSRSDRSLEDHASHAIRPHVYKISKPHGYYCTAYIGPRTMVLPVSSADDLKPLRGVRRALPRGFDFEVSFCRPLNI